MIFVLLYEGANLAYISFYGSNTACTNSTLIGIFITSPINYCENLSKSYTSIAQGIDANDGAVAIMLFFAILYSLAFEQRFKKYLSFKSAIAVAVFSTYLLSMMDYVYLGKLGAGTSLIGFDMMLFMMMGLIIDWDAFRKSSKKAGTSKLVAFVTRLNALVGRKINPKEAFWRAGCIMQGFYALATVTTIIFAIGSFIVGNSFPTHLSSGFIFLLYFFLKRR